MLRKIVLALAGFAWLLIVAGCAGNPRPAPKQPEPPAPVTQETPIVQVPPPVVEPTPPAFDPAKVTEAVKTATFIDIRSFIEGLNKIIQRKDYEAWLGNLTPEYSAYYSDPKVLAQISEYPVLKRTGVKLNSLKDYFIYVVYPSRQNDRVDDIEFVGEQRVKAITISPKGDRQILYNLEKHEDTWKIGIGR